MTLNIGNAIIPRIYVGNSEVLAAGAGEAQPNVRGGGIFFGTTPPTSLTFSAPFRGRGNIHGHGSLTSQYDFLSLETHPDSPTPADINPLDRIDGYPVIPAGWFRPGSFDPRNYIPLFQVPQLPIFLRGIF